MPNSHEGRTGGCKTCHPAAASSCRPPLTTRTTTVRPRVSRVAATARPATLPRHSHSAYRAGPINTSVSVTGYGDHTPQLLVDRRESEQGRHHDGGLLRRRHHRPDHHLRCRRRVHGRHATINLVASDNADGSGIDQVFYKLDDAADFTAGTVVTTDAHGDHTLEFYSIDLAGNVEESRAWTSPCPAKPPVGRRHRSRHDVQRRCQLHGLTGVITLHATDDSSGVKESTTTLTVVPSRSSTLTVPGLPGARCSGRSHRWRGPCELRLPPRDRVCGSRWRRGTRELRVPRDQRGSRRSPFLPATRRPAGATPAIRQSKSSCRPLRTTRTTTVRRQGSPVAASARPATRHRPTGDVTYPACCFTRDVTVTTTGDHTLEFWSVDEAGNVETPHNTVNFTSPSADLRARRADPHRWSRPLRDRGPDLAVRVR